VPLVESCGGGNAGKLLASKSKEAVPQKRMSFLEVVEKDVRYLSGRGTLSENKDCSSTSVVRFLLVNFSAYTTGKNSLVDPTGTNNKN
jgi:hypothetical protein